MATGRVIRRKITESWAVNELKSDRSRLGFTWSLLFQDREGRIDGDENLLRSWLFPRRSDVNNKIMLADMMDWERVGLVLWYERDGHRYGWFPGADRNQVNLRKDRESPSIIPPPSLEELRQFAARHPEQFRHDADDLEEQLRRIAGLPPADVRQDSGKTPAEIRHNSGTKPELCRSDAAMLPSQHEHEHEHEHEQHTLRAGAREAGATPAHPELRPLAAAYAHLVHDGDAHLSGAKILRLNRQALAIEAHPRYAEVGEEAVIKLLEYWCQGGVERYALNNNGRKPPLSYIGKAICDALDQGWPDDA